MIRTINLFAKAVPDTPASWLSKFSSVWLVQTINNGSIDGVERQWNTPGGRSANISALTACQKEKSIYQAVFQKLGNKSASAPVVLNECNRA
jgi:hypothetical protein